jgi:hypothetical protein
MSSLQRVTVADDHLVEIGPADFDAWDYEHAIQLLERAQALPDAARDAHLLYGAAHPIVHFMISLRAHGLPGSELARDAPTAASVAFARRTVHANRSAGLNGRSAERNLRLLDRICSLIGEWPEPEWSETVRRTVERFEDHLHLPGLLARPNRKRRKSHTHRLPASPDETSTSS